ITASGSAGILTLTLGWTYENGAQTANVISGMALTTLGYGSGQLVVWSVASAAMTYAIALAGVSGSPQYSLRLSLERIF
ncbi:MAG: hypothetical protein N2559_17380, partial [Anaerolineae bacterium]|nr:hypothetical protein [Anaerolineae bacterium]